MRYQFDHKKQLETVKGLLHNRTYRTRRYSAFSPINPEKDNVEVSESLMCPKCKMQCTGCTGSCTCHPLFH